jgi:hypothetical protein
MVYLYMFFDGIIEVRLETLNSKVRKIKYETEKGGNSYKSFPLTIK